MTKRLYLENSHLRSCEAVVEACLPTDGGFDLVLDQTVIFHNAGGQPCDTGRIGDAVITGCDERDGVLLHHADRALPVGVRLPLTLDWPRRFDHMQQHTGEHLLSYAAYRLYGANNVGFHLARDTTTIDLDRPLDAAQLLEIQRLANQFVADDLPVQARCYDSEAALSDLPLRKQAEGIRAPIRIVQIEGADCCTCCAPHCQRTSEVGGILITDAAAYKGGMRLNFLCGQRALSYAAGLHGDMDRLARRFSTARDNVVQAVTKLQDECAQLRRRQRELTDALNGYLARELLAGAKAAGRCRLIVSVLPEIAPDRLKALAQMTLRQSKTLTLLMSAQAGRLSYVLSATEDLGLDMGELCQAVNAATGGKGGGRGTLAQGAGPASAGLAETAEQLTAYFEKRLSQLR